MPVRRFNNLLLGLPRDTIFWRLYEAEPDRAEGDAARDVIRNL